MANDNQNHTNMPPPTGREGRRISTGELLHEAARRHGGRVFLEFSQTGQKFTYAEFNAYVNRLAHGLLAAGARRGQYVATLMANCPEFIGVSYALKKIGAVEVAINTHMRGAALARMIQLTRCELLLSMRRFLPNLAAIMPQLPDVRQLALTDGWQEARGLFPNKTVLPFDDLLSDNASEAARNIPDDEAAIVQFTSGTTGVSKGCLQPHRALVRAAESMIEAFAITQEDCVYSPYPFFHVGGFQYDILPALMAGGRAVVRDGFSVSAFWPEVARHRATWFMSLGSVQALLWAAPPCEEEKRHCLRFFWGTPLPVDHDAFEARFGVRVARGGGYGSTDAGAVALPMWDKNGGGKILPRYEAAILDERDDPLPRGEVGELALRPREPAIMMSGYVGMPDKTVQAWRNLWFHTGDLAYLDEDGDVHWVARMSERIRVKGEMVSAYEIEETVLTHPAIEDCAALGAPDETLGEEKVRLFVTLKPGQSLTLDDLRDFCRPRMSDFMLPAQLVVLEKMPRTPTGKAAKGELSRMTDLSGG